MGTFKLKSLEITNYRNIKHQLLVLNGENSRIVGENRVGKTNTIEALYWLLTDKLLNGSKDIDQIKPLDDTKKKVEVIGTFFVGDKEISLGKTYEEEWVKTRGTNDLVFKGHTTTYFYNGVKQSTKKTYESLFNEDFGLNVKSFQGIDMVQMLTNPLYLGRMGDSDDWKNFRAMIIDIVGDVQDKDIFQAHPELENIEHDLEVNNGRTDQVLKQYRDNIKGCEDDIIKYDGQIELLSKVEQPLPEIVETAIKGIEECDANISSMKSSDGNDKAIIIIDQEINELKGQIIEIKRHDLEVKKSSSTEIQKEELRNKINDSYVDSNNLLEKKSKLQNQIENVKNSISEKKRATLECSQYRDRLIENLKDIDRQIADPSYENACPHCGRPYDEDKANELKQAVIKSLNDKKLDYISKGKENKERMNKLVDEVNTQELNLTSLENELKVIESNIDMVIETRNNDNAKLAELTKNDSEEKVNPLITELEDKIKAKEMEKADIKRSVETSNESIRSMVAQYQTKKEDYQKVIDANNYYLRTQDELEKVKLTKKEVNNKLISFEQKVENVKLFFKIKLQMLDEHISRVFGDVSFMLIEPQVNGGYSPVCKPYIKGTKTLWKSGSKSEQLTTGVAIVERIKAALGLSNLPFIFDEGGEVSTDTFKNRFETDSQLICVQVKDGIAMPTVMKI